MKLKTYTLAAFKAHALAQWPKEAVGIINGTGDYVELENTSEDPENAFEADSVELDGAIAVLHTHTKDQRAASFTDMQQQAAMGIPWGIACCGQFGVGNVYWLGSPEVETLEGREFFHGIHDCYSIIRDYYSTKLGIALPDFPRSDHWWHDKDANYYARFYRDAGFKRIQPEDAEVNDVLLMRVGPTQSINHGAILVENNMVLHHLVNRISSREPAGRWLEKVELVLRYRG